MRMTTDQDLDLGRTHIAGHDAYCETPGQRAVIKYWHVARGFDIGTTSSHSAVPLRRLYFFLEAFFNRYSRR